MRLRSVGEHPQAADTLGINVYFMRYAGVMISGFLGGIGGAVYAQTISNNFAVTTIAGPGFIALAAMIFGRWNPIGAMLSSLFFGLSQSLAIIGAQLPFFKYSISLLESCSICLTIVVLAAFFVKQLLQKQMVSITLNLNNKMSWYFTSFLNIKVVSALIICYMN